MYPGNRAAGLFDRYCEVVDSGVPWTGEVDYRADGVELFFRAAIARVGDGVAISMVDLAQRRQAELALKEADRQKDEFLAMLAHELRNPLAPIKNAGELLARIRPDDPRARTIIEVLRRQVTHLAHLVDELLDVSRITQQRIQLKRQPVELGQLVSHAIETVHPLVRERDHNLQILSSYRPLWMLGDESRLVQCIVNVLTNSAKFTDPGGRILVELREEAGFAVLEVTDTGVGIARELLPRVFDLFVQGERTLDRAQGGLGIGLSLVRRLVEMHGGNVSARSEGPGRGATFTIRLPLSSSAVPAAKKAELTIPRKRILVVDDSVDSANTLAMMLQLDGHEVEAVYSGQEVLERVATFQPDIVLLDIGLPGMDGYTVARRLREKPQISQLRLIALTGYGQPEDRRAALEAGFDGHLVKPVDIAELKRSLLAKSG
jgi:signal transduction histidine kinase/ActR/RegA family two-component response regulator